MVSSPPLNAPNSEPCNNTWQASSLSRRLARKPSRLCHTRSFVPSVANPCASSMICFQLLVVLPRVGRIPALPWIGQWIVCHLSRFGIRRLQFENLIRCLSCGQEELFSCTIILLNQPTVLAVDFLSHPVSFIPQALRCGIGRAA